MSITAMKQAREKIGAALVCHLSATKTLLDEADELLRTAIAEEEACEPVGVVMRVESTIAPGCSYLQGTIIKNVPDGSMLYLTPQPAPKPKWNVLAITTAYEQGFGKGIQAKHRGAEISNPYAEGDCREAWDYGYKEGSDKQAPVPAKPANPLESKLVDALLDFDVRGMCAAELLCWHRLTEAESDQLVEFVKIIKEQP